MRYVDLLLTQDQKYSVGSQCQLIIIFHTNSCVIKNNRMYTIIKLQEKNWIFQFTFVSIRCMVTIKFSIPQMILGWKRKRHQWKFKLQFKKPHFFECRFDENHSSFMMIESLVICCHLYLSHWTDVPDDGQYHLLSTEIWSHKAQDHPSHCSFITVLLGSSCFVFFNRPSAQ